MKFSILKTIYPNPLLLLIFFVCANSSLAQDYIKRTTVSAAPHTIETQRHLAHQNFDLAATMPTQQHTAHTLSRSILVLKASAQTSAVPAVFQELKRLVCSNSFSSRLSIDFENLFGGDLQLSLHDLSGRLAWHKQHNAMQQQRIPIKIISLGSYLKRFALDGVFLSTQFLQHKQQQ
jgi:hypothetical protein